MVGIRWQLRLFMAQIIIEVPDDLVQKLKPFQGQLPELFTRFLSANLPPNAETTEGIPLQTETHQEILEFLVSQPTSRQIIDFKVSERSQARLQVLLQKNREKTSNLQEQEELALYERLDELIGLLKVKAFSAIQNRS